MEGLFSGPNWLHTFEIMMSFRSSKRPKPISFLHSQDRYKRRRSSEQSAASQKEEIKEHKEKQADAGNGGRDASTGNGNENGNIHNKLTGNGGIPITLIVTSADENGKNGGQTTTVAAVPTAPNGAVPAGNGSVVSNGNGAGNGAGSGGMTTSLSTLGEDEANEAGTWKPEIPFMNVRRKRS